MDRSNNQFISGNEDINNSDLRNKQFLVERKGSSFDIAFLSTVLKQRNSEAVLRKGLC
jgi:hypothetical protein